MIGNVDSGGRALLPIRLRHPVTSVETGIDAWIDTGFTGDLVVPVQQLSSMNLPAISAVLASLADGTQIKLDTYECLIDWFGVWKQVEVVANQGKYPLLGTGLLMNRKLTIDYINKTVTLD